MFRRVATALVVAVCTAAAQAEHVSDEDFITFEVLPDLVASLEPVEGETLSGAVTIRQTIRRYAHGGFGPDSSVLIDLELSGLLVGYEYMWPIPGADFSFARPDWWFSASDEDGNYSARISASVDGATSGGLQLADLLPLYRPGRTVVVWIQAGYEDFPPVEPHIVATGVLAEVVTPALVPEPASILLLAGLASLALLRRRQARL